MKGSLRNDIDRVLSTYPKLKFFDKGNSKYLLGELDVFDAEDNYWDSFNVRITIPKHYPIAFPKLYEIESKIKAIDSSHINGNGSCCVCCLQEEDIRKRKGITVIEYINQYAIPFLANILYYRENGEYANGEYKHDVDGVIQYYQELFNKKRVDEILREIDLIYSQRLGRNEKCYCGSNLKYKNCHLRILHKLNILSKERLFEDILMMRNKDVLKL